MLRKTICLISFMLCLQTPATANDNSGLIRLTDRDDLFGWEAVGRINIGKGGYCSGSLIANDLVLTAAHCVYDRRTGKKYAPNALTFSAGLRDGKAIEIAKGIRVVADKKYNPLAPNGTQSVRHDVALIKLEKSISSFVASPFRLHSGVSKGNQVSVVSYGQGRDEALSWQRKCKVLGRSNQLLAFDCDVTFGSSGAPVFAKENGSNRILSLISSGGVQADGKKVSFGMELPKIVAQLKQDLYQSSATTSTKLKPTIRRLTGDGGKSTSGAKFITN